MSIALDNPVAVRRAAMDLLARREHGRVELTRKLRIREELTQRGLARSDVEQALRDSGIDWREHLQDTWQRKFAGEVPRDARERAQQGRFLSYRGYPPELIGRLLRGALDD